MAESESARPAEGAGGTPADNVIGERGLTCLPAHP